MLTCLHIVTGTLAVSSGLLGLFVSKGSVTHCIAGRVFTCAMILLGITGIALAQQMPMAISAVAGAAIIHEVGVRHLLFVQWRYKPVLGICP